jgi:hypothetical protein
MNAYILNIVNNIPYFMTKSMVWHSYLIIIFCAIALLMGIIFTLTPLGTFGLLISVINIAVIIGIFQRKIWGAQLYGLGVVLDMIIGALFLSGGGIMAIGILLDLFGLFLAYKEYQYLSN